MSIALSLKRFHALTLALIVCTAIALGQSGQVNGSVRGVIKGPTGNAIANATVQARNLEIGFERKATSDQRGDYEVPLLPIGTIQINIEAAGFTAFQQSGGHRAPVLIDTNLGTPVSCLADETPMFSNANRTNPNYNQIVELQSVANSVYYGGFVSFNKRFSHQL